MSTEIQVHPVQAKVLRELLFKPNARFSELNKTELTSDHFTFHLNKLVEMDLVEKVDGRYRLTVSGKEFANRMDTDTSKIERQAKIAVLVVGVRTVNKKVEYLTQQRLKEPYFGFHGFVTGKVKWGEEIVEGARRELFEETGLSDAKYELVGIEHKMDLKGPTVQEDKFFYVVKAEEPKGQLIVEFEGGRNQWLTEDRIDKLTKKFEDLKVILQLVKSGNFTNYVEKSYLVEEY